MKTNILLWLVLRLLLLNAVIVAVVLIFSTIGIYKYAGFRIYISPALYNFGVLFTNFFYLFSVIWVMVVGKGTQSKAEAKDRERKYFWGSIVLLLLLCSILWFIIFPQLPPTAKIIR